MSWLTPSFTLVSRFSLKEPIIKVGTVEYSLGSFGDGIIYGFQVGQEPSVGWCLD